MRNLTDDLTDTAHLTDADTTLYTEVQREFMGRKLTIEVEVFITFDAGELDCRYYGRVPFHTHIGEGLAIWEGTFLMLSESEMLDILSGPEVQDFVKECQSAEEDYIYHRDYYDTSR